MRARTVVLLAMLTASASALPGSGAAPGTTVPNRAPFAAPKGSIPAPPKSLVDIERRMAELDRLERVAHQELERIGTESEQIEARVLVRGRAYARLARAGLLPVGGGLDALVDHAVRLERLRQALERDLDAQARLTKRRLAVGEEIERLEGRRGPLDVQYQAMSQARAALLAQQDRALAFERAFSTSTGPSHTAIYGQGLGVGIGPADPSNLTEGFDALKGKLPFPLPGRAEIQPAQRLDGPGLEMLAPYGTPVRAVSPGRVAFADAYSDYGKTVIVDHGSSHYTVSANLSEVAVQVGDDVPAGARLGAVGDTGTGPMLYFEIRVGLESVEPREWFGI